MGQLSNKELKHIAKIATNLTHEFTTPLSTLVAVLEELHREERSAKRKMQLDVALRNAYKYRALTTDVFSIARLLQGNNLYMITKTDLVSFLKSIVALFSKAAKEKNVSLVLETDLDTFICYIDFQKVYKICYRLIANGIRFSKAEGGIVKVLLSVNHQTKKYTIKVWDNGIGIIKEKLPYVFDISYDQDPIHLAHYQSTSMGLYYVKHLALALNGSISVSSEKFTYSEFTVSIPYFLKKAEIPYKLIDFVEELSIEHMLSLQEVLHVDTDEILQLKVHSEESNLIVIAGSKEHEDYWKSALQNLGEIIYVNDIDIALGHVFDFVPNLVVLEENLNGISAKHTLALLKRNSAVSHIPNVLFAPNNTQEEAKVLKTKSKADDYITLHSSIENTRHAIVNLLENRKLLYDAALNKAMTEINTEKSLSIEDTFLAKVNAIIEKYISDDSFNVDVLSSELFMSRTQIHRKLKAISNQSTTQYIKRYKLKKARKDIENHTGNIGEIAYKYGFSSPAYFSRVFQEVYGIKPSEVKHNE